MATPTSSSNIVTIFGGSGFVGRYIARRLAKEGWRVRVAVRRVNEAMFVRPYGAVGQVEPVFCNVRDDDSVRAVTHGATAVVYCVGVLDDKAKNTMQAVHAEAPGRVARIAAEEGVSRMVHLSAIGADLDLGSAEDPEDVSDVEYFRTKAAGEAAVLAHMPEAMILRPSVIFGSEDEFINRFAGMTRFGPVLPIVGAETRFQPVWVDDVAAAAVKGVVADTPGVYELGGPDVLTLREIMGEMLEAVQRRRLVMNIPFFVARIMAGVFRVAQFLTFGLLPCPITPDQVRALTHDNVVADGAKGFDALGLSARDMSSVLPDYLWRFRPSGQFAEIKNSARNLKA